MNNINLDSQAKACYPTNSTISSDSFSRHKQINNILLSSSGSLKSILGPKDKILQQPELCECAYIGNRSLSWLPWMGKLSKSWLLEKVNLELSHKHIFWSASKDNIGYGENGLFVEDVAKYRYFWQPECYDGQLLRQAVAQTPNPSWYGLIVNNCQTYVKSVLERYKQLWAGK